jgi:hypothetical protein
MTSKKYSACMIQEVVSFYRDKIAGVETYYTAQGQFVKIHPLTRGEFIVGAVFRTAFVTVFVTACVIHDIFHSALYLIATIFPCCLRKELEIFSLLAVKQLFLSSSIISIGWLGAFFPQTVNEKILQIPRDGLHIPGDSYDPGGSIFEVEVLD